MSGSEGWGDLNKDPGRRLIGKSRRWTLALVVVAVQMASVSLSEIDFRSSVNPGLVISQDRISPAWSAYEDCQSDWGEIHLPALVLAGEPLFAGGRSVSNSEINQWVAGPEALTSPSPQSLPPEPEPLRGMIISQSGNSDNDTTQLALSGDADRGGTSENLGARLVVGSQVADVNDSFISSLGEEFFFSDRFW